MKPRRQLRLLSRYLPRRFLYTILYGAFILFLVFFYRKVAFELSRSPAYNVKNNGDAYDEAGEQIPAHLRKTEDGVDPFLDFRSLPKRDWLDRDFYEREQQRQGNGEQGRPLKLDPAQVKDNETMSKLMDQLYRANGYNAYISDQIPLDRSVKDIRHEGCKTKQYIERLPSVSVILPYHDEHYSTLLRSGYSILNRSPRDVLREIIFVDDASSKPDLLEPFEQHWRTKGLDGIVKVVRTSKREGLIRARAIGARAARGDILVFLDSHSEANYNWLPPLVEPIALNYRTVVCPFVDVIDCDTYEYRAQDEGARGSFDWEFNYKRLPLTKEDLQRPTEPFKSPVMAGGYFAISTKWFWELGGYDEGLDIWGGEQYELSFKIWQCHGQLVDAPCSRVGHIYRCKYVPFGNPGVGDFISRNYRRVAEVWMDEHREHLYKRRTALRTADAGDLSKQKAVRARLKCKTFDWFMREIAFDQDHFYPAVEPPDGANGQIRSVATGKCLDSGFKGSGEKLELNTCKSEHPEVKGEQDFRFSFWEDVRPKGRSVCLDVAENHAKAPLKLFACHGMKGNQHFKYRPGTKQLMHKLTNQCLDSDAAGAEVFMNGCSVEAPTQRWEWAKVDAKVLEEWEQKAAAEQQLKNGRRR